MEKLWIIPVLVLGLVFWSCSSKKSATHEKEISAHEWELEYISGPRIAFDALYRDSKPHIRFNTADKRASGSTSCNNYSMPYTINGTEITLKDGPITLRICDGDGESFYLKALREINSYRVKAGKLELLKDGIPLLRFKKK